MPNLPWGYYPPVGFNGYYGEENDRHLYEGGYMDEDEYDEDFTDREAYDEEYSAMYNNGFTGGYNSRYSAETQDRDETSSQESRGLVDTSEPWPEFRSDAGPLTIKRLIQEFTVPTIKGILTQMGLPRGGNKPELLNRVCEEVERMRPDRTRFNKTMIVFNDISEKARRGRRPFALLPDPLYQRRVLETSAKYAHLEYTLPFPWILETKLTPPILTSAMNNKEPFHLAFNKENEPGARYLLVALKMYTEEQRAVKQKPVYRHAYLKGFVCYFSSGCYDARYQSKKEHDITHLLRTGSNLWCMMNIGEFAGENYLLQIVKARRDLSSWVHTLRVKKSAEILRQLHLDAKRANRDGISSHAVIVSLRCPLSLQRMKKPVRSKNCKHVQCFDMSSFPRDPPNGITKCPICDVACPLDSLYIDGLAMEMLQLTGDEMLIDADTQTWRPVEVNTTSTPVDHSLIDLTESPDDSLGDVGTESPCVKPDPGAKADESVLPAMGLVLLDPEMDVNTNPGIQQMLGRSIRDAIILD